MSQFRLARLSLLLAALGLNAAPALLGMAPAAQAADQAPAAPAAAPANTVRPEIYKLIDPPAISGMIAAKNFTEVQSRIDQANAMPNLTPYENFVLNRMRISLASATSNTALAKQALESVIESGFLPAADKGNFIQALANYYYNEKDYPKAIVWFTRYQTETGDAAKVRPLIIRSYYFGNELDKAKTELLSDLKAEEAAGKTPSLEELQLLANTGAKTKDKPTYLIALEKLVQFYPSDDYWSDLLSRTQGKPGVSQSLELDFYRLEFAAVKTLPADDYSNMGQLDLLAGFPTEAKKVLDAGYAAGVLGTGAGAAQHKKFRDQANKGAADDQKNIASGEAGANKSKDGIGLVNLGFAYVTMGQFDKGIDLMQKGIAKGNLKRPEDAKLHLAVAYVLAGRKDEALKALADVTGSEGQTDLARYWTFYLNRPAAGAAAPAAAN
ncbi:MAG TPA: tetratricopeptide repeat protein [Janthinobacterium sp.]|nr:tetratricopeptide repeat protein [Janthinobacterium sp.]